jgi:hypothetical protein
MSSRNDSLDFDIHKIVDGKRVVTLYAGCFEATIEEFEERVRAQKGDDALYLAALPLIRVWALRMEETLPAKDERKVES